MYIRCRKLEKRLCSVLMLVVAALVLAGCDNFFDVVMENHSNMEQIVIIDPSREYRLRPCSVRIQPGVPGSPGKTVDVRVQDRKGTPVPEAQVTPMTRRTLAGRRLDAVHVYVPPEDARICPEPIQGLFTLTVENYSDVEARVFLGEMELGGVRPTEQRIFGPYEGTWEKREAISVRDPEGQGMFFGARADYDLGEIPNFFIGISPSSDRYGGDR